MSKICAVRGAERAERTRAVRVPECFSFWKVGGAEMKEGACLEEGDFLFLSVKLHP